MAIQSLLKSEGGITEGSAQSSKPLETEMPCDVGQASLVPDKRDGDPSGCPPLSSETVAVQKDPESSSGSTSVANEDAPTKGPSHEGDMGVPDQTNLVSSSSQPMVHALHDGDAVITPDDGNVSDAASEVGGIARRIKTFIRYVSTREISIMQK